MRRILTAIAIGGFGALWFGVVPSQASSLGRACTTAPEGQYLPKSELQAKTEARDYRVQRVKLEKDCAEVYVLDAGGSRVELFPDSTTGSVIGGK